MVRVLAPRSGIERRRSFPLCWRRHVRRCLPSRHANTGLSLSPESYQIVIYFAAVRVRSAMSAADQLSANAKEPHDEAAPKGRLVVRSLRARWRSVVSY